MAIIKKMAFLSAVALSLASVLGFAATAYAVTPTLSLTATANNSDSIQVNVHGDPNVSVILYYTKTNVGQQITALGTTDSNGNLSTTVSTSGYGIAPGSTVYVTTNGLNGPQSAQVSWPGSTTSGAFSLSQTGIVLAVGQSSSITAQNTSGYSVYLSNNSNPPVANVNINGSQITITAISNGSTVISLCLQGNSTSCASAYVTVQNGSVAALTFSLNNVTVAPGQSVPVTVSGGTGFYTILNNSNSAVIQANISGSTVTLTTGSSSGSAAVTVCSSDMSSCGIINAAAGTISSVPLTFSQTSPQLSSGQSLTIGISGGSSSSYYISNNSNSTAVAASISGSNLVLTGNSLGTAGITVCSSAGSCGTLTATVGYVSSGGALQLSQSSISLLTGQVLAITISGGDSPYHLGSSAGNIFQASLNGNIATISAIGSGSASLPICSAGGACVTLYITVNTSGAGTPMAFSQNNLALSLGGITAITITGSGGYYVSNSSNSSIASVQISGNAAVISALSTGSSNISICQSDGQCSILFVSVTSGTAATGAPAFSQYNPTLTVGQTLSETLSGGASSSYYISANTNPSALSLSLNGSQLTLSALSNGSSVIVLCAASNSCGSQTVTVGSSATTGAIYFSADSPPAAVAGQSYSYQFTAEGGSGSYTYALISGSLPTGISFSSSGLISGTPSDTGTNSFGITATDSSGQTTTANPSLTVNAATTAPSTGTYANGQLINENGTVYIVYQNTKVGFANAQAFLGLGFNFNNALSVSDSGLSLSDKVVTTASGAHPRGSWVLSGQTVYFVTPDGLIPVPDWTTFLNNGGQASFIVNANSYDFNLPTLPIMTASDARMHP